MLLGAFLVSFLFIRTSARLIRSPRVSWWGEREDVGRIASPSPRLGRRAPAGHGFSRLRRAARAHDHRPRAHPARHPRDDGRSPWDHDPARVRRGDHPAGAAGVGRDSSPRREPSDALPNLARPAPTPSSTPWWRQLDTRPKNLRSTITSHRCRPARFSAATADPTWRVRYAQLDDAAVRSELESRETEALGEQRRNRLPRLLGCLHPGRRHRHHLQRPAPVDHRLARAVVAIDARD